VLTKIDRLIAIIGILLSTAYFTGEALAQSYRFSSNHPNAILGFPENYSGDEMAFISHRGQGPFDNALALNLPDKPISDLRNNISSFIGRRLEFFQGWSLNGEAHVTVITPPEYKNILSKHVTMDAIENIAQSADMQSANIEVYGVGSGRKKVDGKVEETYFLIVDSSKLRQIRHLIWEEYVRSGGRPNDWDPTWFFPHVTIGFTKQDIHEPDAIKNTKYSFDSRFTLDATR
jgi:hypothetical protein